MKDYKSLKHNDKVKFIYNGDLIHGRIDGGSIIDISDLTGIKKQCCMVYFDKGYKAPDKEYIVYGSSLHIDLNKDIVLCDDGYYLVQTI